MLEKVQIFLPIVAFIIVASTGMLMNTPDNYQPVHGTPVDISTKPKLDRLTWFIRVIAIYQTFSFVFILIPMYDKYMEMGSIYGIILTWVSEKLINR
jgi:hypothetical protein